MVISIRLPVGFHPATRSIQRTPVDNAREGVRQYIEKERIKSQQTRAAVNGTPSKIPAFLPITFTLGSRSHKMQLSTFYTM